MFYRLYIFVTAIANVLFLPLIPVLSLKEKYRKSIPARFALIGNPVFSPGGIHFHMCSYGEAKALEPLIKRFDQDSLRLSTTTGTGFSVIEKITTQSRYLPFEPLLTIWSVPQKALVVAEAELWYLLFAISRRKGARTFLINARISERSFPRYRRFRWLYEKIFSQIDRVFAQSAEDRERLEVLGAKNVTVSGNIKFSIEPEVTRSIPHPGGKVICGASTHETEEEIVLEAFIKLRDEKDDCRLVIVPRHPERFTSVASLCKKYAQENDLEFSLFSEAENFESDITMVDMMGELVNCYAVSDMVILGGAFCDAGGHNAAEAAYFGMPIVSGRNYHNQKELFSRIEGIIICQSEELGDILLEIDSLPKTKIVGGGDMISLIEREIKSVL